VSSGTLNSSIPYHTICIVIKIITFSVWFNADIFAVRRCRTSKQEMRQVSFSRSVDSSASLFLPSIVDGLKSEDYNPEILPYFQRIAVSGEEMSGVSIS